MCLEIYLNLAEVKHTDRLNENTHGDVLFYLCVPKPSNVQGVFLP